MFPLCFCLCTFTCAAQTMLVDFGSSAGGSSYGLAGWNTLIKSAAVNYSGEGPAGLVADASADEYTDYQGVRGSARYFTTRERILVTWYNRSDETIRFSSRISFTDGDQPDGGASSGRWYTMRSAANYRDTWTEIGPRGTAQTMFVICGQGTHKTDSSYSLVNINRAIEWGSNEFKQYLICSSIELYNDADITPPAVPRNLRTTSVSDSKISLTWDAPADNVGVYDYLIYLDGEIEGYSRETSYTCVFLEPGTEARLSVAARDVMLNESPRSSELTAHTAAYAGAAGLIGPEGVQYLGALRLPEEFNWGGESMAYRSDGDGGSSGPGAADGFAGSLFVTNLNQAEHGHVGEVNIPAPVITGTGSIDDLPSAATLAAPVNIRPAQINAWDFVDIWRTGLEYLATEQRLYSAWSVHYTVTGEKHANISCTSASGIASAARYGPWFAGSAGQPPIDAQMGDYLFSLPQTWASTHTMGRQLVVGRSRDGGLSGLGPTLYAFRPVGVTPPAANSSLDITTLLQYGPVEGSDNYHFPNSLDGYKHADEWRGACWLSAGTQNAVAMIGRKAHGDNWYGYHGERMLHDWIIADVPYYAFDETDPDGKGWRTHLLSPTMILFNPADLAEVAAGRMETHVPQPYAAVRLNEQFFFSASREIFSTAFDADHHLLYVSEFLREHDGALVVHVFRINPVAVGVSVIEAAAGPARLMNAPNPFARTTDIECCIPRAGNVTLQVYDMLGRRVAVLADGWYTAGVHTLRFDAGKHGLPGGSYLAVLSADSVLLSRRMLLAE